MPKQTPNTPPAHQAASGARHMPPNLQVPFPTNTETCTESPSDRHARLSAPRHVQQMQPRPGLVLVLQRAWQGDGWWWGGGGVGGWVHGREGCAGQKWWGEVVGSRQQGQSGFLSTRMHAHNPPLRRRIERRATSKARGHACEGLMAGLQHGGRARCKVRNDRSSIFG